jgi:hypothetical protein
MPAMIFLAAAVVLLGAALSDSARPTHAVVCGSLALTSYAAGMLCVVGAGHGAGLSLRRWWFGPWILLWYGIGFGLATLTWVQPQIGTSAQIALTSVLRALWLVAVGITAWALGYLIGPGRPARHLAAQALEAVGRRFAAEVRNPRAPWILYGLGLVGRLASTATTGRFGYVGDVSSAFGTATSYQQYLALLSLCAPLAVASAALLVYREQSADARVTLAVLFVMELAFGAAAGGKQNFVVTVLAVVIPFSGARRRLPKTVLLVIGIVFLLVVVPFNQAYRTAARSPSGTLSPREAIAAAPAILGQIMAPHSLVAVLPQSVTLLLKRIREIDSPAIIVQRTPGQVGFLSSAQLAEAPLVDIVPRVLWPGKPILATGYQLSQAYYGLPSTVYTSSAITPVGDLYRHGGWVPVLAGMFLLGCAVRLLDGALDVRANPHAVFLVLLLFPTLVKNETDWVTLFASVPEIIVVWLFAMAVTFGRRRPA